MCRRSRKTSTYLLVLSIVVASCLGCDQPPDTTADTATGGQIATQNTSAIAPAPENDESAPSDTTGQDEADDRQTAKLETVTLGAGCFWCIEAVLLRVKGVESVVSGYMGGKMKNPTYQAVCTGRTGHAEVVEVKFDPDVISFDQLLDLFWQLHDPTTLNRQGADVGTQYRSAIFYHSDEQREAAEASKKRWNESKYNNRIVTEITAASKFYKAEEYHQNYFNKNPNDRYCNFNIPPKLKKLGLLD